jgi:hypothetical protein
MLNCKMQTKTEPAGFLLRLKIELIEASFSGYKLCYMLL